jgi:hypothetical protein
MEEEYFNRAVSKMNIQDYQGAVRDFSKAVEITRIMQRHIITGVL